MSDKSNRPFTTTSETLTDGSKLWFVLHYETLEKIADESPDHLVIEEE